MQSLLLILILATASSAHASWQKLPEATISEKTLGGAILMLQMKQALVIDGRDNAEILAELGEASKQLFYQEMITTTTAENLRKEFGRSDRPATNATIERYKALLTR